MVTVYTQLSIKTTISLPYFSKSGRLISSQKSTTHLPSCMHGGHDYSIRGAAILRVVVKSLEQELRSGGTREV